MKFASWRHKSSMSQRLKKGYTMNENCMHCGCTDEELIEVTLDGVELAVCEDCARELGFVQCDECGEWIREEDAHETADGDIICTCCLEDSGEFTVCSDCGDIIRIGDSVTVNPNTRFDDTVCEHCAEHHYYQCDDCGQYFSYAEVRSDRWGAVVCDNCYVWNGWCTCESCGQILREDDAYWNERREEWYCEDCHDECRGSDNFNDYGYKPVPVFKYRSGEDDDVLTFGVELEVDDGDDHNDLSDDLASLCQPIYMKHDGSLGDEGVEIVTHPCSLAYHQYELRWAEIARTCRNHNYTSHDAETCGLHIHVGRSQMGTTGEERERTAGNLVLLADKLWEELVKFSRRTDSQLSDWAHSPKFANSPSGCVTDDELSQLALDTGDYGRYQAVNLTNYSTVEFRIFRGTLKRETLIASIQLVSNLTKYAMTHTPTECHNASWADVVSVEQFKELNSYCGKRGL